LLVAHLNGQPVGFVRAIIRRWPNDRVGLEPECGWIPVLAVDPAHQRRGIGRALLDAALAYFKKYQRRRAWVCGNTGSAPGYVFPGVDREAYGGAMHFFASAGFVTDHEPAAMAREVIDFELEKHHGSAWDVDRDMIVETLEPVRIPDFLAFLAKSFPGDWNIAARQKIRAGELDEILVAHRGGTILGYCQWEGEHFGPFGVSPVARGGRIGAKLFVEAVRRIRAADGRSVWFNWADPDAARFYRRFGLHETRRFAILRRDL
jgi:GNAT superfamily N-acetyltransferase